MDLQAIFYSSKLGESNLLHFDRTSAPELTQDGQRCQDTEHEPCVQGSALAWCKVWVSWEVRLWRAGPTGWTQLLLLCLLPLSNLSNVLSVEVWLTQSDFVFFLLQIVCFKKLSLFLSTISCTVNTHVLHPFSMMKGNLTGLMLYILTIIFGYNWMFHSEWIIHILSATYFKQLF